MIGRMGTATFAAGALLALALVAPGAANAAGAQAETTAPAETAPAKRDCEYILATILPGDFDFCLASRYWREGKPEKAAEMLELAAGWGNKSAQSALGVAYFNGDGVAQDRALGLAWLALAAERKAPMASGLYASARKRVDDAEYARADVLYQQLRVRYADAVAAVRADNRYRREVRALESNPAYGSGKCIAGFTEPSFVDPSDADQASAAEKTESCSLADERRVLVELEKRYAIYSAGWSGGRVSVGAAEPLKLPAGP